MRNNSRNDPADWKAPVSERSQSSEFDAALRSADTGAKPGILPLFATPLVVFDVPESAALNVELRRVIEEREKTQESTSFSNLGGWQSTDDMDRWGGPAAIKLLSWGRNIANRVTTDAKGTPNQGPHPGSQATWKGNMWANVNRSGDANNLHSHPGSFWSCVYYVDDGGIGADPALGGELEFLDPRGALSVMNAPQLRVAMPGGRSAGGLERVLPKIGRIVMFPSFVQHQVRRYRGSGVRISIAFNLST